MNDGTEYYHLGEVALSDGTILPDLILGYRCFGRLNEERSNAILFPTWFAGQHTANEYIIGEGRALDPSIHFIVAVNIFGNGISSSPSNMPPPFDGPRFPTISVLDNVRFQRRLLREHLAVKHLALIVGRSMGAQIAFQWGTAYPDEVAALLAWVGSATTSTYNHVFLENVERAIRSDPVWAGGEYDRQPIDGLKHMRLVFDSWGLSYNWYACGLHLADGHRSTAEFLSRDTPLIGDANDLLAQVATWRTAAIGSTPGFEGDAVRALNAIKARAIVMPCRTDMYFRSEESEFEVRCMPNAELRAIDSIWGHRAGSPGSDPADIAFVEHAIRDLLDG